ncbi:MAG: hypothetical protein ACTSX1_00885 [Candidatus Heimdallarchaeaceae archaeon]
MDNKFSSRGSENPSSLEGMRNSFSAKDSNDSNDFSEYSNDFMYAAGASEAGNLWINPDNGVYKFDMDNKDANWLKDSVKPRMDRLTGRNNPVKERNNGLHRFRANSKDHVPKMKDIKDNPDMIRGMNNDQQNAWLNGYLDGKMTVDVKGKSEPTTRIVDRTPERLSLAKDLLKQNGIESKLQEGKDRLGSNLQIKGKDNHQKLNDNIKLENPTAKSRLSDLLNHPERFEKPEKHARQRVGKSFEKPLGKALEKMYPNSKIESEPRLNPGEKNSPKPDFRITHPDGTIEIAEAKLGSDDIKSKDHKYGKHADKLSFYYLEESEKDGNKKSNDKAEYNNKEDLMNKLDDISKDTKDEDLKESISGIKYDINKISEEAKEAKEKLSSHDNDDIKTTDDIMNSGTNSQSDSSGEDGKDDGSNNDGDDEGGGGGKEYSEKGLLENKDNKKQGSIQK